MALVACLPHLLSLPGAFVYDDFRFVAENPGVQTLEEPLGLILDPARMSAERDLDIWRPLRTLCFALQYSCFGGWTPGYHALSILLFFLLVGQFFFLLDERSGPPRGALVCAALAVGWHPITVESVAWISSQGDLLAAALALACLRTRARPDLALFWLVLALLAKESAVPLLGLLFLDWCLPGRPASEGEPGAPTQRRVPAFLVALALTLTYLLVRQQVLGRSLGVSAEGFGQKDGSLGERMMQCGQNVLLCIQLFLAPLHLSVDYGSGHPWRPGALDALVALGIAGVSVVAFLRCRRGTGWWIAFAWCFFLPTSGLLFVLRSSTAERFLLLPLLGLAALLAIAGSRFDRTALRGAVAIWLLLLLARSVDRIQDWRDPASLFAAELAVHEDSIQAHMGVAAELVIEGDPSAAAPHFRRLLELTDPADIRRARVLFQLAIVTMEAEGRVQGIPLLEECRATIRAAHPPETLPTDLRRVWSILANVYLTRAGLIDLAEAVLEEGLELFGPTPEISEELGLVRQRQERFEEAVKRYREAASLGAESARLYRHLGEALEALGRTEEAMESYAREQALLEAANSSPNPSRRRP